MTAPMTMATPPPGQVASHVLSPLSRLKPRTASTVNITREQAFRTLGGQTGRLISMANRASKAATSPATPTSPEGNILVRSENAIRGENPITSGISFFMAIVSLGYRY